MPIYPFERPVFPRRFASPFVTGKPIKAPGGIGDAIERPEGEKLEGGGIGRKRTRKNAAGSRIDVTDRVGQSKGVYVGPPVQSPTTGATGYQYQGAQPPQYGRAAMGQQRSIVDRSIMTAAGGAAALGANAITERLPPETGTSTFYAYFGYVLI
jgi:chromatin structure-remodeling complex subunit RSC1/2